MRSLLLVLAVSFVSVASSLAQTASTAPASAPADPDYWVAPMKAVHARFTGQAGTVMQVGDSITITMAFFTPLRGKYENVPTDVAPGLEWLKGYAQNRCWMAWKGGDWGNEGMMTSKWGKSNIEGWLAKMNPEVAVIMFGTNDLGAGPKPPEYTDNMRFICQKCIDNGTIPILHTIPPVARQAGDAKQTAHVETFVAACRQVTAELKIPLIDFYKECMTRNPDNFAKALLGDGVHPSFPKEFQADFSDKALANSGYTLRNYCLTKSLWEVNQKVFAKVASAHKPDMDAVWTGPVYQNRPAVLFGQVARPPTIDGKLDDACWQQVKPLPFRMLDGDCRKPTHPTQVWLGSDKDTLYIAFKCTEPDMTRLAAKKREHDAPIWEDDSVEIFLRPGAQVGKDYYHLAVNAEGSYYDARGSKKADWDPKISLAAAREKDFWAVELAIPLSEIQLPAVSAAAGPWRINLTRFRTARKADGDAKASFAEDTALAPTNDTSSHVPDMFGYAWVEAAGGKLPEKP